MAVQKVDIAFHSSDGEHYGPSVINMREDGRIAVEFHWRGDRYTYEGREHPDIKGKFQLTCPAVKGSMTLYKLAGGEGLMGRWSEKDQGEGLLQIDYAD